LVSRPPTPGGQQSFNTMVRESLSGSVPTGGRLPMAVRLFFLRISERVGSWRVVSGRREERSFRTLSQGVVYRVGPFKKPWLGMSAMQNQNGRGGRSSRSSRLGTHTRSAQAHLRAAQSSIAPRLAGRRDQSATAARPARSNVEAARSVAAAIVRGSGCRSPDWLKMKNPACAAMKREQLGQVNAARKAAQFLLGVVRAMTPLARCVVASPGPSFNTPGGSGRLPAKSSL
jgi:hypothetical protein